MFNDCLYFLVVIIDFKSFNCFCNLDLTLAVVSIEKISFLKIIQLDGI